MRPRRTSRVRPWMRALVPALAALVTLAGCGQMAGDDEAEGGAGQVADASATLSSAAAERPYAPGPPLAQPPPAARPLPSPAPESTGGRLDVDALGFTRGSPEAPLRVVEFSDFGCGFCRKFHQETWPILRRDYVATGKVRWKMIPFDVGMFPHSRHAVLAGECAGEQGRFDALRERLFDEQRVWKGGSAAQALDLFRDIASEAGLDMARFNRCMAQGWRVARVDASNALARRLGVRGTPTFYILGYGAVPGALPAEQFAALLDRALAIEARERGS